MKIFLINTEKKAHEPAQGKTLFRTKCKSQGKCCKMVIDSGSTDFLVSTDMVEKLGLKRMKHPTPFKVSQLQKGHQLLVNEQCNAEFQIGTYKDEILCDIIPMDVCHILLGRPWKYDRKFVHDGRKNTYSVEKDGKRHALSPLEDEVVQEGSGSKILLMSGKELLKEVQKEEDLHFSLVGKPKVILTSTNLNDFPIEVITFLDECADIIVDELPSYLPCIGIFSHHIDLIPSASLPNKAAYRLTPLENE